MSNVFNTGIQDLGDATINWGGASATTQYGRLLKSAYTVDVDHDYLNDTSTGTMSQGAGNTSNDLDGETISVDTTNDECQFDATDETFSSLASGDTPYAIVIYKYNASDAAAELLCYCVLTSPPAPNGGDYTIVWDAEGVFEISN